MPQYRAPFYELVSKSGPAELPVSVGEVGAQLRMNKAQVRAQSNLLTMIIKAVRNCAENVTRRSMLTKEWIQFVDFFPGGGSLQLTPFNSSQCIEMGRSVFQEILEIRYLKNDETTTVVIPAADYYVDKSLDYSRVLPVPNTTWPTDVSLRVQSIEIQFKVGYGDTANDVPDDLREAMLQHAAFFFENRGDCACDSNSALRIAPPSSMGIYENNQILFMAL